MLLMNVNVVTNSEDRTGVCTKNYSEKGQQQEFIKSLVGVFSKRTF